MVVKLVQRLPSAYFSACICIDVSALQSALFLPSYVKACSLFQTWYDFAAVKSLQSPWIERQVFGMQPQMQTCRARKAAEVESTLYGLLVRSKEKNAAHVWVHHWLYLKDGGIRRDFAQSLQLAQTCLHAMARSKLQPAGFRTV